MGQTTNHDHDHDQLMERLFMIIVLCYLCASMVGLSGQVVEAPQYRVLHSESDFEFRLYRESSWMSAQVRETTSFEKATKDGFHRLYQYIHGDNLNSSRITMTAPVLTSIVPSVHGPEYHFDKRRSHCIAIRKFPGFAKDEDINEELEDLLNSLNKLLPRNLKRKEFLLNRPVHAMLPIMFLGA